MKKIIVVVLGLMCMGSMYTPAVVAQSIDLTQDFQAIQMDDVEKGKLLAGEYLDFLKKEGLIGSLTAIKDQMGNLVAFKFVKFKLSGLRLWPNGKNSPGILKLVYDVTYANSNAETILMFRKANDQLLLQSFDVDTGIAQEASK